MNPVASGNPAFASDRPSPVKFTSQRPEQFPIKPTPERLTVNVLNDDKNVVKHKMLSLETLKDALPDFGKEEVRSACVFVENLMIRQYIYNTCELFFKKNN